MSNPLFKHMNPANTMRKPSFDELKSALKAQDDAFYQRMADIARQRGISEKAIEEGMNYIATLRH